MTFRDHALAENWPAVAMWLAGRGLTLDPGTAPRQFAGGLANRNYRVRLDDGWAVFRRPPDGVLAHGASDMGREARVLGALAPVFPLAPRLLAFCANPAVIGVPFQLLEWRAGVAVGGAVPAGLAADCHCWMLPALAGAMAALHALDPAAVGLGDLGRATGFAARQLRGWAQRADAAFGGDAPPALAPLLGRLGADVPPDAPPRLLHMDPKFDNLLVDPDTRSATALIDWDMATLGPPAFDLAVLLSYWIVASDPPAVHGLAAVPSLERGWPGRADVVAAYTVAAGGVPGDLGWYLALARLRLATAWMQLYRLWQQGGVAGDRYAGFHALADAVIAQGLAQFGEVA